MLFVELHPMRAYEDDEGGASSWVPRRRKYEHERAVWIQIPDCFTSASRTCYEPLREAYGGDLLETIRTTDLTEICAYAILCFQVGSNIGATEKCRSGKILTSCRGGKWERKLTNFNKTYWIKSAF